MISETGLIKCENGAGLNGVCISDLSFMIQFFATFGIMVAFFVFLPFMLGIFIYLLVKTLRNKPKDSKSTDFFYKKMKNDISNLTSMKDVDSNDNELKESMDD